MIITDTVIQKLLNYLSRRPYRDVQELISAIINEANKPENKNNSLFIKESVRMSREPELPLEDAGGRSS